MKTKFITLKNFPCRMTALAMAVLALVVFAAPMRAQTVSPQITSAQVISNKLALAWSGNSYSYEVQTASSIPSTNWTSILATFRNTNVLVPLQGSSAFYRIIDPDTNLTQLDITVSNMTTGDYYSLSKLAQTNADLAFIDNAPPSGTISVHTMTGDDLRQFDMAFDGLGGFSFVTTNGEPTQFHGQMASARNPGTNTITYTGHLTDGNNFLIFTSIAADPPLNTGDAAFSAVYCAPAWAAQNLQCQAAASALIFSCLFSGGPVGIITSRTGVTVTGTNIVGECTSTCVPCCKNKATATGCNP